MATKMRTLTLGGLAADDRTSEQLTLPLVTGTTTEDLTMDALQDAILKRAGIALIGDKGVGKTEALRLVCQQFESAERERQSLDASYRRRRLQRLPTLVTTRYRDVLTELLKQVTGTDTRVRVHGTPLSDDSLLARLCTHLFERNIVTLIIDQAEACAPDALRVLRDLMTVAADRDERRKDVDGVIAAGVGVLLVGTPPLRAAVTASEEYGHRWARVIDVEGVHPEEVSAIYELWFPQFAPEITRRGTPWWESTLDAVVSHGQIVATRSLVYHAIGYFNLMAEAAVRPITRETVTLEDDVFRLAAQQVVWQRTTTPGDRGRA